MFGDDVNTDYIISSTRKRETIDASVLKRYLLESIAPGFAASVQPGDMLVAGTELRLRLGDGGGGHRDSGGGHSRRARARASRAASTATPSTTACSWSSATPSAIAEGDRLSVELADGGVAMRNLTHGDVMAGAPMPAIMLRILEHGGLVEFLAAHGGFDR